jgi:hypothetical protein
MESRTSSHFGARDPHPISINLATIQTLLDTLCHLGSAYGSPDEYVIAEDVVRGHLLQASIRQDGEGWTLIVRSDPPLEAIVSFHIDHDSFHQQFSRTGEAAFGRIPEVLLRAPINLVVTLSGPELSE